MFSCRREDRSMKRGPDKSLRDAALGRVYTVLCPLSFGRTQR